MSEPFIAEIKLLAFNFPPRGWALCNGQLLPINQNQALFSLLGTTYGGNGQTTFALPNMQGRAPVHAAGGTISLGEISGEATHTLTSSELPQHVHSVLASTGAVTGGTPGGNYLSNQAANAGFSPSSAANTAMTSVGASPGAQPHENMQPYLVLNFSIALVGIFPSRN